MAQSTLPPSGSISPQNPQGETHQISRAAGLIGAATFCSRILGFLRDIILANLFGANAAADAVNNALGTNATDGAATTGN